MGCKGLSRVDFFLSDKGEIILNEINTMPGFTAISMYPKLMQHLGMTPSYLMDKLIEQAIDNNDRA
jgi:D-alanine-D-alanine ligase